MREKKCRKYEEEKIAGNLKKLKIFGVWVGVLFFQLCLVLLSRRFTVSLDWGRDWAPRESSITNAQLQGRRASTSGPTNCKEK